jgi:hypothetical protein
LRYRKYLWPEKNPPQTTEELMMIEKGKQKKMMKKIHIPKDKEEDKVNVHSKEEYTEENDEDENEDDEDESL